MTKSELLEHIAEAIRTEESATQVYLTHIHAIIERSGLPDDATARLRKTMAALIAANTNHIGRLQQQAERIAEAPCHVYEE